MTRPRFACAIVALASFALLALGCSSTTTQTEGVRQDVRQVAHHDARAYFETTRFFGSSFSPDESQLLVTSDATGVFNAYRLSVTGGAPTPLTNSTTDSTFGVTWFPNDDRILYSADRGGNELSHLYVRNTDGSSTDITPGEKLKADFVDWTADRKSFWVTTNERDERYFDLYRYATDGYARERVFTNDGGWSVSAVSRDGRWLALGKVRNNVDSDVFLADLTTPDAKPKLVTGHQGNVQNQAFTFTPASDKLVYSTDGHGEFAQAWTYDLASGDHAPLVQAKWDVQFVTFSENGRYRAVGINEDAHTAVTVLDTTTHGEVKLPSLPDADIAGVRFSRSEARVAFYVDGDASPSNLHVIDLKSGAHQQITNTLNPTIRADELAAGKVVRFPSFDRLEIPAILYRPWTASPSARVPALVWVHGGPGGQSTHGYSPDIQHLLNNGYAVLAINNRGSSGYGKTFFHLDDRRHGEDDLQDCIYGRRYLASLDWIDGSKIGILGGSYGGFMVAAALTLQPNAFDVGVDLFGVTNWIRTLQSTPAYWADFREYLFAELGDPATDEARLRRISPLFHADQIKKPLLVFQGANDPRVLQAESDELVAGAKKNGVPVEYVVFADEGHGFQKRANRITAAETTLRFLNQYLRGTSRQP
ncbi:MAG: S9 family peptidase [Planctomycetes bacterium]|nr:S9 family peptidase [Planctomycetota bacterium]MBI3843169.1 S9 family peptidase [Planctomycetota bacterium]